MDRIASVPAHIKSLSPYVPGKPIEETQREFKLKRVVKLASNENPLGTSSKVVAASKRALRDLNRYPDASAFHLKSALSKRIGATPSEILISNGSNEAIELLIRTLCQPGDELVTHKGAFVAYKICAQAHGVKTREASIGKDLKPSIEELIREVCDSPKVRLLVLANPNNPTGVHLDKNEIERLFSAINQKRPDVWIALDDAYGEYVDPAKVPNAFEVRGRFKNVVVLKTFSKVYGMAALRVGYLVGDAELVGLIERIREPFNVNSIALEAARAALLDRAFVKKALALNTAGRKFWERALKDLGIPFWPTQGNFVLCDVQAGLGVSGVECFNRMLKQGVILRPVANYGLPNALRISFGTDQENRFALKGMKKEFGK